ncbi:MAG TPA: glutathione S-transferase [Gammaproteobacteria bacterium]|nr:glutathione S-transferase [Gammaproteobacteria bacterium]
MYTLYFIPDACSLAIHSILNELDQPLTLIHKQDAAEFAQLNPVQTVPVLVDEGEVLCEGAAILLHLLDKHDNRLLPRRGAPRQRAIEQMLLANATVHPAYGRLFFIDGVLQRETARHQAFAAAAAQISALWQALETRLQGQPYLGGEHVSAADFLLAVYYRWGALFPVEIETGPRARAMVERVLARDSVQRAIQREQEYTHHAG